MSDDDLTVVYLWAKKESADEIERLREVVEARERVIAAAYSEAAVLREALREIADQCQNTGYGNAIVMERIIDRIESIVIDALKEEK